MKRVIFILVTYVLFAPVPAFSQGSENALDFDGVNDHIGTGFKLNQSSSSKGVTYMAWVYPTSNSAGRHQLISPDNSGYDWSILREGGNWHVFTGTSSVYMNRSVTLNKWQHVAAVFIPGTGVRFYKNGLLTSTGQISYDAATNNIWIGGNPGGYVEYFQGRIDEVSVWDTVLTTNEIRDWMCKSITPDHPKYNHLQAYYKMDDGAGNGAHDSSPNNRNATLLSMAPASDWVVSGAPIGDRSVFWYTTPAPLSLPSFDGNVVTLDSITGTTSGVHLYAVDGPANSTVLPSGYASFDSSRYWGWFNVSITLDVGYRFTNDYSLHSWVRNDTFLGMAGRFRNDSPVWLDNNARQDTVNKLLVVSGLAQRNEHAMIGVATGSIARADHDIGILQVLSPVSGCGLGVLEQVAVRMRNEGVQTQTAFDLGYKLNGSAPVVENVGSLSIPPGGEATFTFSTKVNLATTGSHYLTIFSQLPIDQVHYNDTISELILSEAPLIPQLSPDISICEGASTTLAVTGGVTYLWNTGNTTSSLSVSPGSTTSYWVTVTGALPSCVGVDTVTISVIPLPAKPVITAGDSTTICTGDSVLLQSSLAVGNVWSTGDTSAIIFATSGGDYTVSNAAGTGCPVASDPVTVTQHPAPSISASPATSICLGDTATLSVNDGVFYVWSTGEITQSIRVAPSVQTLYSATVTNSLGCINVANVTVSTLPATAPGQPYNMFPVDGSLSVTAPVSFSWLPASNAASYDIYLWKATDPKPSIPSAANLTNISYTYSGSLQLAEVYNWQVIAKNSCYETGSPTQQFTVKGKPNLTIASFSAPAIATSGGQITVSWEVINNGNESTGSQTWDDRIWLSPDIDLRKGDDVLLGKYPNFSYLLPGESYLQTKTVILPALQTGTFFIFVISDNEDAFCLGTINGTACSTGWGSHSQHIAELNEQDNRAFDTLTIFYPPLPDLIIQSVGTPTAAFGGDTISLTYSGKNIGEINAGGSSVYHFSPSCSERYWQDRVFLSADSFLSGTYDYWLQNKYIGFRSSDTTASCGDPGKWFSIPDELPVDSSYSIVTQIELPHTLFGTYYFIVDADYQNKVYEGIKTFNNQNVSGAINITLRPPPDLVVTSITHPGSEISGTPVTLSWTVKNQGGNPPFRTEKSWKDQVHISQSATFDPATAIYLGFVQHGNGTQLLPDSSYSVTHTFSLPQGIFGDFYVYVKTDALDDVFEYSFNGNNRSISTGTMSVALAPYPDLVVTDIQAPDTVRAGQAFNINWVVSNQGSGSNGGSYLDRVYVSPLGTFSGSTGIFTQNFLTGPSAGLSLTRQASVTIPWPIQGDVDFYVHTDCFNYIYEYDKDGNNIRGTPALGIGKTFVKPAFVSTQYIPYCDLRVSALSGTDSAISQSQVTLNWTVLNEGIDPANRFPWTDAIYLSDDAILSYGDQLLKTRPSPPAGLLPGQSYSVSGTATLPIGISGNKYLIVKTNYTHYVNNETTYDNNYEAWPVHISLAPSPDLVVTAFSAPATAYAGQSVKVFITVMNQGPGTALSASGKWYDGLFLSNAPNLGSGSGAIFLGSKARSQTLLSGESYSDSIAVNIPAGTNGNFYLLFKTDHNNLVFEHNQEGNNLSVPAIISIQVPPPADLVVGKIVMPDSAFLGEWVSVDYTIHNQGTNTAFGKNRNAFYFSSDDSYQTLLDPLLGYEDLSMGIPAGDSVMRTLTRRIPSVDPAGYFGLVRTNLLNAVPETDISNNTSPSVGSVILEVPELFFDIPASFPLDKNDRQYFRLEVAVPAQDIRISLTSNQSYGLNEIYVAKNRVPKPDDYDYRYRDSNSPNQQVLLPEADSGTWYIFIQTKTTYGGLQSVDLLAEVLPFTLLSISPSRVGQGPVSTLLLGAGFRNGMTVEIRLPGSVVTVALGSIVAFPNTMEVSLRWDFSTTSIGVYDLIAINPGGITTILPNGLEIEDATPYMVDYEPLVPTQIRRGKTGFYSFHFRNNGNIDIPVIHGDFQFEGTTRVKEVKIIQGSAFIGEDWDLLPGLIQVENWYEEYGVIFVPFIGRNFAPGDELTITILVDLKDYPFGTFPVQVRALAYPADVLVGRLARVLDVVRLWVLADPERMNVDSLPEIGIVAENRMAFLDSMLAPLFRIGMLMPADTADFDFNCLACLGFDSTNLNYLDPGEFTYSPGGSPGQLSQNSGEFGANETYLWEINKYGGARGADPGWDLIQYSGTLDITATPLDPFVIYLSSISYQGEAGFLAGWYPAVDKSWPIVIANGGITGFDTTKFDLNLTHFLLHNQTYGGHFSLRMEGSDTIMLVFTAYIPGIGEDGVPGAPGALGENGSPGGQGGPGTDLIQAGTGGTGGAGGPGNGVVSPGNGGHGGQGGMGGNGQNGGIGGQGGAGGDGGTGQGGGTGGDGGEGGPGGLGGGQGPGGVGGNGGAGGPAYPGSPPPPGGPGGSGGFGSPPGSDGDPGPEGSDLPPNSNNPCAPIPSPGGGGLLSLGLSKQNCDKVIDQMNDIVKSGIGRLRDGSWTADNLGPLASNAIGRWVPECAITVGATLIADGWGIVSNLKGSLTSAGIGTVWGGCVAAARFGLGVGNCINETFLGGASPLVNDMIDLLDCVNGTDVISVATNLGGCMLADYGKKKLCTPVVNSCDPNVIIGPEGFNGYVAENELLSYQILFENDPDFATTSARRVKIDMPVDPQIDILSLRLGDFGFGTYAFQIPPGQSSYSTVIDLQDSLGWNLEVTGGVDVVNQRIFWVFQTIDPGTGLPPYQAGAGFLAVNDSSGAGEGYVNFTLRPAQGVVTGDSIFAMAEIIFDENDPIETNLHKNVIDAFPPFTVVAPLSDTVATTTFDVVLTGSDDPGGSGILGFNLYVSEDGLHYSLESAGNTSNTTRFTGIAGRTYHFFSAGADNVGHLEATKNVAEEIVTIEDDFSIFPLELLYLEALPSADAIELVWATSFEVGTDRFEVNRKEAGGKWKNLHELTAAGYSHSPIHYSYSDHEAVANVWYQYRIRMLDQDGSSRYSNTVAAILEAGENFVVGQFFPNPTDGTAQVYIQSPMDVSIRLEGFDLRGSLVLNRTATLKTGLNSLDVDMREFPAGVYYLALRARGISFYRKLIKY